MDSLFGETSLLLDDDNTGLYHADGGGHIACL